MTDPIYLDYNATTPILPEVVDAMLPYLRKHFGNPSSAHIYGRRSHQAIERARAQVAALIGCHSDEILFTSGGTEANNLAIRGAMAALEQRGAILTSCIEHPATEAPCALLESRKTPLSRLAVNALGRIEIAQARRALKQPTALVTVMHANNETGVIQPIAELADLAHAAGALLHSDAAQSLGKVRVNVDDLGVDMLSIAGHKLYAPKGVGALYLRRGTALKPLVLGAGHEGGLRPGTENLASIVGLGAACVAAKRDLQRLSQEMKRLRDLLWQRLSAKVAGLARNGDPERLLPNTLNVRFPNRSGDAVLAGAPQIAASTGSACHAGGRRASAVILAMGIDEAAALGSVRLSLGRHTTEEEVEAAAQALVSSWERLET